MKKKAKFLIKQSLDKKIKSKWFIFVNILIFILILCVINIDSIINVFGGDFKNDVNIIITGDDNYLELFNAYFSSAKSILTDKSEYNISASNLSIDTLKNNLVDTDDIVINITKDIDNYLNADIISYNKISTATYNLITTSLNSLKTQYALNISGLSNEELSSITKSISINRVILNEKEVKKSEEASSLSMIVFLIPVFILIMLLTQMIGADINDEKTTRGMEIIISNVSPTIHFLCKIISSCLFVIIQSILLFIYSGIGTLLKGSILNSGTSSIISSLFTSLKNTGTIDMLISGLPLLIILFLLSFFIYATLAGVLASMTTSNEDFQQLQTPLMTVLMLGYYIGIMAASFKGSIFIRIFSYLPFFSSMVAPITYILGETSLASLGISCIILLISSIILFRYGIRVYKVGILNYSSKDLWKKVFKSLKGGNT